MPTADPPVGRLALTYDECRVRFARAAIGAGLAVRAHPIDARGRHGEHLSVDVVRAGASEPERALVVLSGVHGVEGFIGSELQCRLLGALGPAVDERLRADGAALVLVHAVNPWGMSWWRRVNESNVDLNRNWDRDRTDPPPNDAYDELHPLACPDTPEPPSTEDLLATAMELVERRGLAWVRDGLTRGQYRHPDGLHYGGERTEASTAIVASVAQGLVGVASALVLDLHTGHGPRGEVTLLSDQPPDAEQSRFLAATFPEATVEATVDNPGATTGYKTGQLANGIRELLGADRCHSTSVEFGTVDDLEQLRATYLESWVHRCADPGDPEHAELIWQYRCCFTPDDPAWVQRCVAAGDDLLERAVRTLSG